MTDKEIIMHKATSMNSILCGIPTFTVNAGWTGNSEKVTCPDCLQIMEIQSHNTQPNMNEVEFIAAVRHIGWITYQIAAEQPYNEEINDDQHKSLIDGVIFVLENPNITPEENHENWMRMKFEQGWKYGDVKDFDKKTHPDLVPYEALPNIEKRKDTADNVSHRLALELWNRITK